MGVYRANIIEHPLHESFESIERRVLATLRPAYETQRQTTLGSVIVALAEHGRANLITLADQLHSLAGTAAHFQEHNLGELARTAENTIRTDAREEQQLIALRHVRDEIERIS